MIGLKRFIRPGFVISAIGHLGVLVLGLLIVGANSSKSSPPDAIPPDAMLVDVVPPDEAPRFEGTPADSQSSGSESALNFNSASAAPQPFPPKPTAASPQQPQQRPNPQRDARQTTAQPPAAQPQLPQSDTGESVTAQPEKVQPEAAATQSSEPPPSPPQPDSTEAPDQPASSETFARLALLGGRLGGGFEAPPVDAPEVAHDFTLAFRERVSSCSSLPAAANSGNHVAISLRVSLNPDGTLASAPQLNEPITSPEELALMQSALSALQKCQPYTMLPAEKYKQWKTLDLIFAPQNFSGR